MIDDDLIWLLNWYYNHCDSDWEHGNIIKMGTVKNSEWEVKISLLETELSRKSFQMIDINHSENNWVQCSVKNEIFQGAGGYLNLSEIIQILRNWAES